MIVVCGLPALRTFCAASWPNPWVSRATRRILRGNDPEPFDQYLMVSTVPGALRAALSVEPWRVVGVRGSGGCAGFCAPTWRSAGGWRGASAGTSIRPDLAVGVSPQLMICQ